jgi:hypothetical protein
VQTADIAADAITTAKIAAGAVETSDIAANAIDSTLTKDALIADYTEVTIATGDSLLLGDVNDSGNTKRDTVQGLLDLVSAGGGFTLGTEQATTSGSSVTFGSIPTGTTMITMSAEGVSSNGTSQFVITIGDAGGLETSGYDGGALGLQQSANVDTGASNSASFNWAVDQNNAAHTWDGQAILVLKDASNFTWTMQGICCGSDLDGMGISVSSGFKSLSAELTQISFSTSDTLDAGSVNITYQ